jgi:hypothetical protein
MWQPRCGRTRSCIESDQTDLLGSVFLTPVFDSDFGSAFLLRWAGIMWGTLFSSAKAPPRINV